MANTIREVAKEAGVSIATVSRVLNNSAQVNEAKRRRVEDAVKRLDFIPNQAARSLVKKKTRGIGILLSSLGGDFFSEFLQGIDEASRASGYYVLISASHGSFEELDLALKGMNQRVDGLIVMPPEDDSKSLKRMMPDNTPVMLINSAQSDAGFNTINFDNYRGAYTATEYLVELGHRNVAMLKGPDLVYDSKQRLQGYRDALLAHDIYPIPDLEIPGDFSQKSGYLAGETILKLKPRPTAIFCANDLSAIGLMGAMQNAGLKIPESISVVGFDDIPGAKFTAPPLTTIRVGIRQMGRMAMERIVKMRVGRPLNHDVLPIELVVRDSTASFVK